MRCSDCEYVKNCATTLAEGNCPKKQKLCHDCTICQKAKGFSHLCPQIQSHYKDKRVSMMRYKCMGCLEFFRDYVCNHRNPMLCNQCKGARNIMKIVDRRVSETQRTLTLGEIPFNRTFEFIDLRKPYHCSTFIKMTVCHTYRRGFHDKLNQTWAFDIAKGKLCQFSNNNEVRLLEAEFHIIGELNG